jgi:FMN phosphatase YigB (HAD superfamily)
MKTIVWDVDDVLNDLMKEWFLNEWLSSDPGCILKYEELTENPPCRLLNISFDSYLESLDKFRIEKGGDLNPLPEIIEWFNKHGHKFNHAVLTATPLFYSPFSAKWVLTHFGKWIRSYNFIPSPRKNDNIKNYQQNKAGFLKMFDQVDLFIDDNNKNIEEVNKIGIKTLLVPKPWNNSKLTINEILEMIN